MKKKFLIIFLACLIAVCFQWLAAQSQAKAESGRVGAGYPAPVTTPEFGYPVPSQIIPTPAATQTLPPMPSAWVPTKLISPTVLPPTPVMPTPSLTPVFGDFEDVGGLEDYSAQTDNGTEQSFIRIERTRTRHSVLAKISEILGRIFAVFRGKPVW